MVSTPKFFCAVPFFSCHSAPSHRRGRGVSSQSTGRRWRLASLTASARRSLNIELLRDPVNKKCICSIPRRAEFIFKCRDHFEQLSDADAKKLFWPEVFGYPTAASSLLTLVIPNLHSGSNLLAMIVYPHRDRFREKDISTLGSILAQFEMLYDIDPSTFFVHC